MTGTECELITKSADKYRIDVFVNSVLILEFTILNIHDPIIWILFLGKQQIALYGIISTEAGTNANNVPVEKKQLKGVL